MFSGMYLPALETTTIGEIVCINDSSGSIGEEVFARAAAELGYIAEIIQPERIRVIWADDEECSLEEVFEPGDPIVLHPKGGGGTDMRKPLAFVEKFEPIVVVLITDCYSPWPKSVPYPLIILCTDTNEPPKGLGQIIHLPRTSRVQITGDKTVGGSTVCVTRELMRSGGRCGSVVATQRPSDIIGMVVEVKCR